MAISLPPLRIEELRRISPRAITLTENLATLARDQPTIIMRSFQKAPTMPMLQPASNSLSNFLGSVCLFILIPAL